MINNKGFKKILFFIIFMASVDYGNSMQQTDSWFKQGMKATDLQEKVRCFEKAIEENPALVDAHFQLGCAYRDIGELLKAEKAFNTALRASPENVDNATKLKIVFELGKTYLKLKKTKYAKEAFLYANNIVKDAETKSDILYELGKIFSQSEEFDQALKYFNEGIQLNPKNMASFRTSIENTQRLKELHRNYNEGLTNLQQGFYTEAVNAFTKVVQSDPNFKDAADKLYQSQIRMSRINEKLSGFNSFNESESKELLLEDSSQINDRQVSGTRQMVSDQNQVRTYEESNELEAFYQRGLTAMRNDQWRTAVRCFSRIIDENPNYRDVNSRLMEAKLGMESIREMEEVAKFYNEAMTKFEEGDWLKSIIEFEKAKMLYPGYKDIELKIAEAKQNLKKSSTTKNHVSLQEIDHELQGEKSYWLLVGMVISGVLLPIAFAFILSPTVRARFYLMQGKYKKACQLYEHILSKKPQHTKISITLANIYLINERRDEMALKVYQVALQSEIDSTMKQKITSIIASDYLKRNIIDKNSVGILTQALQEEIKKLNRANV